VVLDVDRVSGIKDMIHALNYGGPDDGGD